jgi:hypothetical protein
VTDDLFAVTPDPSRPARPSRLCRRHDWYGIALGDRIITTCRRCGRVRDDATARRGRTNRSRGNAIERDVAKALGMRRVGQYGGPDDARGSLFAAQVKSGKSYPERLHTWLKAVPVDAGQVAILVITDAPGPGHRRRGLVVLDLADWRDLHGEEQP